MVFDVAVPDIAMVQLKVLDKDFHNEDFIGQVCIPFNSLQQVNVLPITPFLFCISFETFTSTSVHFLGWAAKRMMTDRMAPYIC